MSDAYIFGKTVKNFTPDAAGLSGVTALLAEKKQKMAQAGVNDIIRVLDSVSKAWSNESFGPRRIAWDYLKEQTGYSDEMLKLGFDAICYITSAGFLKKRINSELNAKYALEKLDGLQPSGEFTGRLKIVPLGALLHVSASNVFISAVDSLVSGFITKNVNILKLSHGDMLFPILFANVIREFDESEIFSDCFSIFYYKGGDAAAESAIKDHMDAVVVWGGAEAVAAWRACASPKAKIIEYGPKISFSLVDLNAARTEDDVRDICSGLASDIAIWEQAACSSPQCVYLVESNDFDANFFSKTMLSALREKEETLPSKTLSLDEKIEVLKFRERAYASQIDGNGEIFCEKDGTSYGAAISRSGEIETSCLFRNILVKPVKSFDEFYGAVSGISFYLQAVSIYAADETRRAVAEKLYSLGVNRVLSPGWHGNPPDMAPHDGKYFLNEIVRYVSYEFPDAERENTDLLSDSPASAELTVAKLKNITASAFASNEYYKSVIDPGILKKCGGEFLNGFKKIPFLGKREIYENCLPDSTRIISENGLESSFIFASGGSTGDPKFSVYGNGELEYVTDVLAGIYRVAGIKKSHRVANIFIAGGLWTSFIVANMAIAKIGATNLPIGGNTGFQTMYDFCRKLKPDVLVGLPSVIVKFAEYCETMPEKINVDIVLYGGEHMRQSARDRLEKVFGVRSVVSAGYAAVDCGPIGFQCECLEGSLHHVLTDYQYVEFIKDDGSEAENGETGEIVVTNLDREKMPVIRFKTGDIGMPVDHKCGCGRSNRVFELLGRCDDILVVGGANITPHDFDGAIAFFSEELSSVFQIAAVSTPSGEALELYVERGAHVDFDEASAADLKDKLTEKILEGSFKLRNSINSGWLKPFTIHIMEPGSIERSGRTGKVRAVKDKRDK